MDPGSIIRSAPRVIELGGDSAATCQLDEGLIAVEGKVPDAAIARFEGDGVAVAPVGSPGAEEGMGPVYRGRGGGLAVPTGRVLVRFGREREAPERADALAEAGFEIEEVVRYAPQAAWVRPRDGGSVEALNGLERLRAVRGVEHVEPQVLTLAVRRGEG